MTTSGELAKLIGGVEEYHIPEPFWCVYFLIDKNDVVQYVGMTGAIRKRMANHEGRPVRVMYVRCETKESAMRPARAVLDGQAVPAKEPRKPAQAKGGEVWRSIIVMTHALASAADT